MNNVTILGQNINLVRPARIARPITSGAWKGAKASGRKTRKLTWAQKLIIAEQMNMLIVEAS